MILINKTPKTPRFEKVIYNYLTDAYPNFYISADYDINIKIPSIIYHITYGERTLHNYFKQSGTLDIQIFIKNTQKTYDLIDEILSSIYKLTGQNIDGIIIHKLKQISYETGRDNINNNDAIIAHCILDFILLI